MANTNLDVHDDRSVELCGVSFAALTERQVVDNIIEGWERGVGGWVSTPNVQQLRLISANQSVRSLVNDASLAVADGMPLIWAASIAGNPLPERVAGSSLVWSLARSAATAGATIFLLGGDTGVAERAGARLQAEISGVRVAGTYCPAMGFEHDPREIEHIRQLLLACRPDLVYVGLGFPKQERLIQRHLRDLLPDTWFLGVGISLSFISGDRARAPTWMQRLGLEWTHRLLSDPARLYRRYLIDGIPFTLQLLGGVAARRVRDRIVAGRVPPA